ncbi:unnamed protein product [Parajaminaea phylloscopi]
MTDCDHPIHAGGMCAICGVVLSEAQASGSISMMHDTESVTVSREEAQRLDSQSTTHLLDQRKLALIVDLDQTIIHATVDPTVGEWLRDPKNPNYEALRGVGSFRLGMDGKAVLEDGNGTPASKDSGGQDDADGPSEEAPAGASKDTEGCWYYVKPRPGLTQFLRTLAHKYELHVYTMGTRSYADCVCKLVDPDGSLFGTRILSRDENGSLVQKSLSRLFPMDTSMVVIIDDRGDVWQWSPNLIKVIPYDFFLGSGDINGGFLPAQTGPGSHTPSESASGVPLDPAGGSVAVAGADKPTTEAPATERLNDVAEKEAEQTADVADQQAKAKAEQSQKSIVSEQLDARPLARMQEQLDEQLGVTSSQGSVDSDAGAVPQDNTHEDKVQDGGDVDAASEDHSKPPPADGSPQEVLGRGEDASPPTPGATTTQTATPPQRSHALLRDDDNELARVQDILETIHSRWYSRWDAALQERQEASAGHSDPAQAPPPAKPTVIDIISELKKDVLRNCELVFSSLIPLGGELEDSEYFWMALEYGATCSKDLKKETTHLVAAKNGTAKVNAAHRQGSVQVVWPTWLHESIASWSKKPERFYNLPRMPLVAGAEETVVSSSHPTDDELSLSDDLDFGAEDGIVAAPEKAEAGHVGTNGRSREQWTGRELDGMNWEEADKELEEYLNGSGEDDDDDDEGDYDDEGNRIADFGEDDEDEGEGTDADGGYGTDKSLLQGRRLGGKGRRGKRSRRSTPSVNGDAVGQSGANKADGRSHRKATPPTPSALGKRRRLGLPTLSGGAPESGDTTSSTAEEIAPPPSYPASVASSSVEGDETTASLMRDLEDEIEAALEGEDGVALDGTTGATGTTTGTTATGSLANSVAGGD